MTLVESREYGQNELLITHYYQNPLFKLKDAFLKACGKLDIDVLSIDDTFNDYLIAIKGVEVLMKFVARKANYSNANSVRSNIDKTIDRAFNQASDISIFHILDEFYGEKMTTKEFISSCVLYVRKNTKNS